MLSTHSNTLQFSQQTNYSFLLIQTPFDSYYKTLQLSTHSKTYYFPSKLLKSSSQYITLNFAPQHPAALNSFKYHYYSSIKHLKSQLYILPYYLLTNSLTAQLNILPHYFHNTLLAAFNSFKHLTILTTNTLNLPTHPNT